MADLTRRATLIVQFQDLISQGAKAAAASLGGTETSAKKLTMTANELNLATLQLAEAQKKLAAATDPVKQAKLAVEVDNLKKKIDDNTKAVEAYALGLAGSVISIGAFTSAIKYSIDRAMEAETVMAKTEAVLKSTGDVSGMTAQQVSDLANKLAMLSGADDETIQSAENVMLTFTKIGGETFPRAMKAALDMSMALGTDLQGAVIQVGKALQDPVAGLTALRKVGVNFDAQARETIKSMMAMNDVAGAQKFILQELETEFGGMAEAIGNTTEGKLNKMKVAVDNLAESIGKGLLPVLGALGDTVTPGVNRFGTAMDHAVSSIQGTLSPLDELQYQLDTNTYYFGENSKEALAAKDALEKYKAGLEAIKMTGSERQLRENAKALYETSDALKEVDNALPDYGQFDGAVKGMEALAEASRQGGDAAKVWADFVKNDLKQSLTDLKTVMAGAIQKENKDYIAGQDELAAKARELGAELRKLQEAQGQAIVSTSKVKLSEDEIIATRSKLAAVTEDLTLRVRKKNETDAEFAARMDALVVQQDKLNTKLGEGAQAVTGYVDNTKKIGEVQAEYDAVNAKIEENAANHEEATKRILFGYMEQEMARDGLTATELAALDQVAANWGLKSQAEISAMQAIRSAQEQLAKDGNIDAYNAAMTAMLGNVTSGVWNYYQALNSLPKEILIEIRQQFTQTGDMVNVGHPEGLGGGPGNKPTTTTPSTKKTTPSTPPKKTTKPKNTGAQMAAGGVLDVPSGYPNDSFPINVSSGERVIVIPQGQGQGSDASRLKEMLNQRRADKILTSYRLPTTGLTTAPATPSAPQTTITVNAPITVHAAAGQSPTEIAAAVSRELSRALRGARSSAAGMAGG